MFELLDKILVRRTLEEYGADKEMLKSWAKEVMTGQERLLKNNFVPFDEARVYKIYCELYEK